MNKIVKTLAIVTLLSASASANAWWNNGSNMWDGAGNGDFSMNMSFSGRGHGDGRGYGYNAPYYGYPGYAAAPYGYPAPVAAVTPATTEKK